MNPPATSRNLSRQGTIDPETGTDHPDGMRELHQGTIDPEMGTTHPDAVVGGFVSIDFGDGTPGSLAIHTSAGPVEAPRIRQARTGDQAPSPATRFIGILNWALMQGPVVVESATVGSSGAEPEWVRDVVTVAPHQLWLISGRAVKNQRADDSWTEEKSHIDDARIIWEIATSRPERLKLWQYGKVRYVRKHRSVRPHDKRNYIGPIPDYYISRLPAFSELPAALQQLLGNKQRTNYLRAKVFPLALAFDEEGSETRAGYENVIGLYEHGYASFYRRTVNELFQAHCKRVAGVTKNTDVPLEVRKREWSRFRRQLRRFYHLCQATR